MDLVQRQNRITAGFLLLSILLHLLLLLIPKERLFPVEIKPEPVYVEVRPTQPKEWELDIPVRPELEKEREKPAKRLGPADQVVEQERAPIGEDAEDRPKSIPAPRSQPQPQPQAQPRVEPSPEIAQKPDTIQQEEVERRLNDRSLFPKPSEKAIPSKPLPDLQSLTQLSPTTLAKIESDWRQKYREDVAKSDTVWMDTEQDLLSSFMRRFRDNVYLVWNYPSFSRELQRQGTCLLKVTIDRNGDVLDVQLLESTGFRELDEEALRAVREGATYGPLPSAYTNPDLKIMAFFQYRVGRTFYKKRRPGDIY